VENKANQYPAKNFKNFQMGIGSTSHLVKEAFFQRPQKRNLTKIRKSD
jgi:hypothetical protein